MSRKEYKAGSVVVSFDPDVCIHSEECVRGLPKVFDTNVKPWIQPGAASPEDVEATVRRCPSGALEFRRTQEVSMDANPTPPEAVKITPLPNGPYVVEGKVTLRDLSGKVLRDAERLSLCRCGQSAHKPLCDGSHSRTGFQAP